MRRIPVPLQPTNDERERFERAKQLIAAGDVEAVAAELADGQDERVDEMMRTD